MAKSRAMARTAAAGEHGPPELGDWRETGNGKGGGDTRGEGESTGHQSGRHIIAIKGKKKTGMTDDNWAHMARVGGHIKRHGGAGRAPEGQGTERRALFPDELGPRSGDLIRSLP
ncbi:DUF3140 domain-containing protein [Falsirhodobacter deserti]|uniref:DUF3140 domain-containing protein n=1 Tax=Falsirhodobacter deserti TaxID=1365611 RepID=UPI0030C7CCFE